MKSGLRQTLILASRALAAAACLAAAPVHADADALLREAETAIRTGDVFGAMRLLRKAADQDQPGAQARLADLLHAAEFDAEAVQLYRRSAEQGHPAGQYGLGKMYADGAGVPRDAAAALSWYRKAEAREYWPALDALARAYRTGDLGLPMDLARARDLQARVVRLQEEEKKAQR